jgi:hypothetical protein
VKDRVKAKANPIFERTALKLYEWSSTVSRVRLIVKPTDEETQARRKEKLNAIEPFIQLMPSEDVALLMDNDLKPILDRDGNTWFDSSKK